MLYWQSTTDSERKDIGFNYNRVELQEFDDFILSMDLVDTPMFGSQFTWFNLYGSACSRLDRYLVLGGIVDLCNIEGRVMGPRILIDYCPIWLQGNSRN